MGSGRRLRFENAAELRTLETLKHVSEITAHFSDPELILLGGYALRAFVTTPRFSRDCDFALRMTPELDLAGIVRLVPPEYSVERHERLPGFAFARFVRGDARGEGGHLAFMFGQLRGLRSDEVFKVSEDVVDRRRFVAIPVAEELLRVPVPDYTDYFIMKVLASRPSDVSDIASLLVEKGLPPSLEDRVGQVLPFPQVFWKKLKQRILPLVREPPFTNVWNSAFRAVRYSNADRRRVAETLERMLE